MAEWPEVFEDLYITSLPIKYVETILIEFSNGGLWEIDMTVGVGQYTHADIDKIMNSFYEYKEDISNLEFKIDIKKLKIDVKTQTKKIL